MSIAIEGYKLYEKYLRSHEFIRQDFLYTAKKINTLKIKVAVVRILNNYPEINYKQISNLMDKDDGDYPWTAVCKLSHMIPSSVADEYYNDSVLPKGFEKTCKLYHRCKMNLYEYRPFKEYQRDKRAFIDYLNCLKASYPREFRATVLAIGTAHFQDMDDFTSKVSKWI